MSAVALALLGPQGGFPACEAGPGQLLAAGGRGAAGTLPADSGGERAASPAEARLGEAVFNTLFVPAGTPGAARHSGLGPLFDAASCDECHNGAAQARGPATSGPAPTGLIIELEEAEVPAGRRPAGDPRYGLVLSTDALPGVAPEAQVTIRYRERRGRYPDGTPFTLRMPRYLITHLGYGPLASRTRIEPRLAPSLFGVGWLARVPASAIVRPPQSSAAFSDTRSFGTFSARRRAGREEVGRFGWQATSVSVRDQTAKALARDMGVTSREYPRDDCTPAEAACRARSHGGTPEISSALVDALVAHQMSLAPPGPAVPGPPDPTFVSLGCAACHSPRLPVKLSAGRQTRQRWIAPYTDLRLHFLGTALDDRDASGRPVLTRWRTAPLWNLADRRHAGRTLLHDGRARSIAEAILWHGGEADASRVRFMHLPRAERQRLLEWLRRL